ncbi:Zn-dependent hydrolase [Bacillus gobiensis]|uniref:Zn-dependent hydrolase n=1 Tax=Bacillus gobiensis TaxID=1441095 RepID=UPI003D1CDEAD
MNSRHTQARIADINIDRLMSDIDEYGRIGKDDQNGVTRPSFSAADFEARKKLIGEWKALGLEVIIDGAANIWGKKKGTGKKHGSIVIGSHLDSVPNGGKYDGPLGVLMAKELLISLGEHEIILDHDLEIVSFTAEESNDFNLSTFGSRSFSGKLAAKDLEAVKDSSGMRLADALKMAGGSLESYPNMYEQHTGKKAFLELHIEQGKRLEENNIAVAAVDHVAGIYRNKITFKGEANHSGTTVMNQRKDALAAAAEMILFVEELCLRNEEELVGTIGKLDISPNAVNIVPGSVQFTIEVRGKGRTEIFLAAKSAIASKLSEAAEKRGMKMEQEIIIDQDPIPLDKDIVQIVKQSAEQTNEPCMTLTSMAVHDAAHMAAVTKSAMLFVKSVDGKSHCPEEYSSPEDIARAGKVLLDAIFQIDQFLS